MSISTESIDLAAVIAIERAEAEAWADLTAAVPADHARAIELGVTELAGALVLRCRGGGFHRGLFNRPIGLGVFERATREAADRLLGWYAAAGVDRFIVPVQPHSRPDELERWLVEAGLARRGSWDRVFRGGEPLATQRPSERAFEVELVDAGSVDAWADFLSTVYRVDAGPWLRALLDRPGWRHVLARENEIVAARSSYLPRDGALAFLAVDGPVPGVMTQDYEPDAELCEWLVADALERGAAGVLADIEAPSPALDTPAYEYFGRLGFARPYARVHYALV